MAKRSAAPLVAKRVWRMTTTAPLGAYAGSTESTGAPATPIAEPEIEHGGWIESSFDLLRGLEVIEHDVPLSAEVLRSVFGQR